MVSAIQLNYRFLGICNFRFSFDSWVKFLMESTQNFTYSLCRLLRLLLLLRILLLALENLLRILILIIRILRIKRKALLHSFFGTIYHHLLYHFFLVSLLGIIIKILLLSLTLWGIICKLLLLVLLLYYKIAVVIIILVLVLDFVLELLY